MKIQKYMRNKNKMKCHGCYVEAKFFCSQCMKATYCSKECQKKEWDQYHSISCNPYYFIEGNAKKRVEPSFSDEQLESVFYEMIRDKRPLHEIESVFAQMSENARAKNAATLANTAKLYAMVLEKRGSKDDNVKLEANDGTKFEITHEQARRAQTILDTSEDAVIENYISYPHIDGGTLARIVRYLQMDPIVLDEMTPTEYFNLIRAANYLDFKELLDKLIPFLLKNGPLTYQLIRELQPIIFPALFFVSDLDQIRKWIVVYQNDFQKILTFIDEMLEYIQLTGKKNWAIRFAAKIGFSEAARLLLADTSTNPADALEIAARYGNIETVLLLMKDKRSKPSMYKLEGAIENGYSNIVRLFFSFQKPRINIMIEGGYFLGRAIEIGKDTKILKMFLDDDRVTPENLVETEENAMMLTLAAENGPLMLKPLMEHPKMALLLGQDNVLFPAFIISVERNYIESVRFFLDLDYDEIDPFHDEEGRPLWEAIENNNIEITKMLIEDGRFDINFEWNDAPDEPPIVLAAKKGHVEIFKMLLNEPDIDVGILDNLALRMAFQNNHVEIVDLLIKDGRADSSVIPFTENPKLMKREKMGRQIYL